MRKLAPLLIALLLPATASAKAQRDVLVVSNNWAGTADIVDPHSFKRLKRVNVIPDKARRIAEIKKDVSAKSVFDFIRENIGEGHNQYVDDGFVSKDGRYVYFSRPSFADVVAIDLKTRKIAWRVKVDGHRAAAIRQHAGDSDVWAQRFQNDTGTHVVKIVKNGNSVRTYKVHTN